MSQQRVIAAATSAGLNDQPGVISLAVGADYRREAGGFDPDPLTAGGNGLTHGNQITAWRELTTLGGLGEASDLPVATRGARGWSSDFAPGLRLNNLRASGVTWKAGGIYRTEGGFAVRGTFERLRGTIHRRPYMGPRRTTCTALGPFDNLSGGEIRPSGRSRRR